MRSISKFWLSICYAVVQPFNSQANCSTSTSIPDVSETRLDMTLNAINASFERTRDYMMATGTSSLVLDSAATAADQSNANTVILENPIPKPWENWNIIEQTNQSFKYLGDQQKEKDKANTDITQNTNFVPVKALNYVSGDQTLTRDYTQDDLDLVFPVFPLKNLEECTFEDWSGTGTEKLEPLAIRSLCLPNNLPAWSKNMLKGCRHLVKISAQGATGSAALMLTAQHGLGRLKKLESIELPATVRSLDDTTESTEDKDRIIPVNVTSLIFPETIVSIGNWAVAYCTKLTSLILANRTELTTVGKGAFASCSLLSSVDLSGCTSLTKIGGSAFANCSNLILFDASLCTALTTIEEKAFQGCNKLVCAILPTSVTKIGSLAFARTDTTTTPTSTLRSLIWRGGSGATARPGTVNIHPNAFGDDSIDILMTTTPADSTVPYLKESFVDA